MNTTVWCLEDFDFHKILCPYKLEDHVKRKPNKVFNKNEFLFMEMDPSNEIILIDKGKVKIGRYDSSGNENVLAFCGKGEVLGHMALLGETKHKSFAEVMEDGTQICKMDIQKAKELTRDYIPFALEMNRRVGNHFRKMERRIELLMCKSVRTRVVEFLQDLGNEDGRSRNGGIWISHNLTQSDIAALIATSRKSASLVLNELEDAGYIAFDRRHIFIPNLKRLTASLDEKGTQAA